MRNFAGRINADSVYKNSFTLIFHTYSGEFDLEDIFVNQQTIIRTTENVNIDIVTKM